MLHSLGSSLGADDTNLSQLQRDGIFAREGEAIIKSFSCDGLSNDALHSDVNMADDTGSTLASGLYALSDQGQSQHEMSDDIIEQDMEQVEKSPERSAYSSEAALKMENRLVDSPQGCISQGTFTELCSSNKSLWNNVFSMCSGSNDNWDGKLDSAHTMGESLTGETEPGPFPSGVPVCR